MPDGLYDTDALAWSEQQAALLRRLASGESVNEAVDWPNVIEELEDVGLSQLRSCRSLLLQAMVHLLKLHAWPASISAGHWRQEAGAFLDDAEQRFSPSMAQRIELDAPYAKALRRARDASDDSGAPTPLPNVCPFSIPGLLAGELPDLLAEITASGAAA